MYNAWVKPDNVESQVGGPPVTVTINLAVMSLGPVDENKQTFSLDCYFRQYWVDERLKYNATGNIHWQSFLSFSQLSV